MKVTKIPGLGRFGVYIDDIDLNNITQDEWAEIGKLHLESLVTIIRNTDVTPINFYRLIMQWGPSRWNRPIEFYKKYGKPLKELVVNQELDDDDQLTFDNGRRWQYDKRCPGMVCVTPKKDANGESIGIFGDGELLWHSNECGDVAFTPGVALLGHENTQKTATGFCTSPDWYEKQTESFRSELDEMVIVHNYRPKAMSPVVIEDQEKFYKNNMAPEDDMRVPLIIKSPGGIKGVHLGVNTFDKVEGMSVAESKKLFDKIQKEMITDEYCYNHWYNSRDICLFDNSITLHNRSIHESIGYAPERLGLRIQYDFDKLTGEPYEPFYQEEFNELKRERLDILDKAMEGMKIRN